MLAPHYLWALASLTDSTTCTRRILVDMARLHPVRSTGAQGPLPPAMALPTLPPVWDLEDWELPGRLKQIVATARDPGGAMVLSVLPEIVEACARRGHGWPDLAALLEDSRYAQGAMLAFSGKGLLGLKQRFRQALDQRDARFPPRLAWGIREIARLGPVHPGEGRRYVLRGRNAGRPFELEVPWEVLDSSAKLRTALARHLEVVLPPVPPGIWRPVLAAAMRDPRCFRQERAAEGRDHRPLTARIGDYLRGAEPYRVDDEVERTPSCPTGWPVVRDGAVVFPLAILHGHLCRACPAAPPGRAEVAKAVRSLGGGPHGVLYFGKERRIRVWTCPLPRPRPGRAPHY